MRKIFGLVSILGILIFFAACDLSGDSTGGKLNEAYEALNIEGNVEYNGAGVDELSFLPKTENGTNVKWTSSDETVIRTDGKVFHYLEDKMVTVTAELSFEGETKEKTFEVTVKKIDDDVTLSQVFEAQDESQVVSLSTVHGVLKTGFYVNDGLKTIFVESNVENVVLGGMAFVSGVKKTSGSQMYIEANEKTSFYLGTSGNVEVPTTKKPMVVVAGANPEIADTYGTKFTTDAVLQKEGDEFFLTSYPEYVKAAVNSTESTVQELTNNLGKKAEFSGMYHKNVDGIWEIVVLATAFDDLDNTAKILEISKWLTTKFPSDGFIDGITQLDLPSTHPVYGGEIEWGTDGTHGIIDKNGVVSAPIVDNFDIQLTYTIALNGESVTSSPDGQVRPIILKMSSMIMDVREVANEEKYNEAKTQWSSTGYFEFAANYHVKGEVISYKKVKDPNTGERYAILMRDLETEDIITYMGNKNDSDNEDFNVGDIVTLSDVKLITLGKKLFITQKIVNGMIQGSVFEVEAQSNPDLTITYVPVTVDEFMALDFEDFSTYNKLYEVKDAYVCAEDYDSRNVTFTTSGVTTRGECASSSFAQQGFAIYSDSLDSNLDQYNGEAYKTAGKYKSQDLANVFATHKGYAWGLDYKFDVFTNGLTSFVTTDYAENSEKNVTYRNDLFANLYEYEYSREFASILIYDMMPGLVGTKKFTTEFIGVYAKPTVNISCSGDTTCYNLEENGESASDVVPRVYLSVLSGNIALKVIRDSNDDGFNTEFSTTISFEFYDETGENVLDTWELNLGDKVILPGTAGTENPV